MRLGYLKVYHRFNCIQLDERSERKMLKTFTFCCLMAVSFSAEINEKDDGEVKRRVVRQILGPVYLPSYIPDYSNSYGGAPYPSPSYSAPPYSPPSYSAPPSYQPPPYSSPSYPAPSSYGSQSYQPPPYYRPSTRTDIALNLRVSPDNSDGGNGNYGPYGGGNMAPLTPTSATLLQHFAPAPPPEKVYVAVPSSPNSASPYVLG